MKYCEHTKYTDQEKDASKAEHLKQVTMLTSNSTTLQILGCFKFYYFIATLNIML